MAVDRGSGMRKLAYDPNPQLREKFRLGHVDHFTWHDKRGRSWNALLYSPVGYRAGVRFPLVIQTHGYSSTDEFSLSGMADHGVGPADPVFVAQALANRGIGVLQIENKPLGDELGSPAEAEAYQEAYETAVEQLGANGLLDRRRVGITGYSRTGWHVEYALTHSRFPFACALVAENTDPSYIAASSIGWYHEFADDNGGEPFGESLREWLERSPGFNADRIRVPLRLQQNSMGLSGLVEQWEMFSRLRYLDRPVELYVIPDVQHGSHTLQNPRQLLASGQGAVDWFDFWLNGREDPDPTKLEQYARWRRLREQRDLIPASR